MLLAQIFWKTKTTGLCADISFALGVSQFQGRNSYGKGEMIEGRKEILELTIEPLNGTFGSLVVDASKEAMCIWASARWRKKKCLQ